MSGCRETTRGESGRHEGRWSALLGPCACVVRVSFLGVSVGLAGAFGCAEPPTQAECERMLDHYTELLVRSDRPQAKAAEREKLKAEARSKASRDPEFGRCSQRVSRRQLDCALGASDVDAMERCLL